MDGESPQTRRSGCACAPLSAFCFLMRSPQAPPGPTAVLIDEFDASALKSASNYFEGCSTRFAYSGLDMANGYDANTGTICKILLSPVEQAAGCPALCRGDHRGT